MNEQKEPGGIEWTRVWGRRGYTLNPVKGCTHECEWRMPDGLIAKCYAKEVATRLTRANYPNGFEEVRFTPRVLEDLISLDEPSGIFIDSMSDLFGVGTKQEWTDEVLRALEKFPQHVFFSLTKNAPRLLKHTMPHNLWCGISAPATFMFGKELSEAQQRAWFKHALESLSASSAIVRWLSLEPLSIDVSDLIREAHSKINWAVIGAASNGRKVHQPDRAVLKATLEALYPIPVFFKGNMSKELANDVAGRWLNNFPDPDSV